MSKIKVNSISSLSGQKVEFPNGVSGDGSGLYFQPNVISFDPVATSTGISSTTNITILFDQDVEFSGVGTIYIRESSPTGTISTYFTCGVSTEATIAGSTLVIDPRDPLNFSQLYVVTLPSVGIANTYGQYYRGTQGYSFTTAQQAFTASGGDHEFTIASAPSPTGYYKYHVFTSTGILTTTSPSFDATSLSVLMVAGGGGSQGFVAPTYCYNGGGGGAGGRIYQTGPTFSLNAGTYTVTIGAGGIGTDGGNTTISTPTTTLITAYGGGGAITPSSLSPGITYGYPGGSGGGGLYPGSVGSGLPGQGNPGGSNSSPSFVVYNPTYTQVVYISGAGGGAGGAGQNSTVIVPGPFSATLGNGGAGAPSPEFASPLIASYVPTIPVSSLTEIGPSGSFAGGGGGGGFNIPSMGPITGGSGGSGGGGDGGRPSNTPAQNGFVNTGGGGGGGGPASSGGSGVFMIRYAVPAP